MEGANESIEFSFKVLKFIKDRKHPSVRVVGGVHEKLSKYQIFCVAFNAEKTNPYLEKISSTPPLEP